MSSASRDPPPAHGQMAALVVARPWHLAVGSAALGLALATGSRVMTLVAAVMAMVVLCGCRAPSLGALAAALVLGGAAGGELRLQAIDRSAALIEDGRVVDVSAHLLTPPRPSAFGSSAEVGVTGGHLDGARLLIRVPRWERLPEQVRVGDELRLRGRLRALGDGGSGGGGSGGGASDDRGSGYGGSGDGAPNDGESATSAASETADGAFDFAAYLRRRGIAAELLLDDARATGRRRGGIAHVLDLMRERAQGAVAAGLPPPEAALARGMVLGQDEAIAEGVRDDFRASGLAHLLAVSGQNVMLLVALALPLLAVAGLGPRGRGVALLGLVALYVPLAGAGPSLQRAGVMGAAGIAATTLSRPASRWYALLLAAAATLALNPRAWEDPGWQLSFAAVVGILCLGVPLGRAFSRAADGLLAASAQGPRRLPIRAALARGLAEGAAITLAATLATAPLLAHHFDAVPVAGLPANLLALPAVAPAMWLGMVKAGLGLLAPLLPPLDWLAGALGPLTRLPVAYISRLAELFAQMPGGQLSLPLPSRTGIPIAYALLAAAAVLTHRAARALGPHAQELAARWRARPAAQRLAAAATLVAVLVLLAVRALAQPDPPDTLTVRFLDVGQGDATLVQDPDGSAVLFDAGPPEAGTARLLRRAGVRELTAVVATHASRDHHGGLAEVLDRFHVGVLLDGGDGTPDPTFRAMLAQATSEGVRIVRVAAPMTLQAGGLTIRILSPPPRPPGPAPEDPNPRAVVAVVSSGGFDLLLSADAESEALLPLRLPEVEAMKVPHHGSSDPGLPQVLERLRPQLAAIEVGVNTYGHPAPPTLAALKRAGVRVYRTDRDGTVTLSVEGGEMHVTTEQ